MTEMKLNNTKPHVILKDPEKAAAQRQAKIKAVSETLLFLVGIGLVLWWIKSPDTLKQVFYYLKGLLS
ncbi:hypothetical protein [Mariprofundus sp. KV]|uniref:hypothetical protein n=1 Tax=Mariprofundus sp. KV TaxID=2608715 RepID=UPI0015A2EECB|nr:hypothetical protein [Mariprofundus sp. KV]NWF35175.1 hypothetical protein [Mariprofundus sp. KV]